MYNINTSIYNLAFLLLCTSTMEEQILYDQTTELILHDVHERRLEAVSQSNFEVATQLRDLENELLLTGATLMRIHKEVSVAIHEERFDDASKLKRLAMEQREIQHNLLYSESPESVTSPVVPTVVLLSPSELAPPVPSKVIETWIRHARSLCDSLKSKEVSLNKLVKDYKQSKEHNAEEMFMQTVETTITPEMFDMMKPIILEIEAEHIVHEMRQ